MARSKMEKQWRKFHKENPEVELELLKLAQALKKKGHDTWGLPALWEVLRYEMTLRVPGFDHKFPNGYKAYYARLLMLKHRKLEGFFRIRDMHHNGEPDLSDLV